MGDPQAHEGPNHSFEAGIHQMDAIIVNSTVASVSNTSLGSTFSVSASLYTFHDWYKDYHGYVSVFVCIYGIVTNVFNIVVLTRKNMISTSNLILLGLAVSDLLTMASYVPFALQFYCIHGVNPTPQRNSQDWVVFLLFHINFTVTTHTTSIWLGVLLSVFRYLYVKYATDRPTLISIARAKLAIVLVYVCSVIILIPTYLSFKMVPIPMTVNETNYTLYDIASLDGSSTYNQVIMTMNFWIHAILIKIIPCGLMLVFGFLLVRTMRISQKRNKRLRRNSRPEFYRSRTREHSRTTKMMVLIIALFLITELPQGVLALFAGIQPGFFMKYYMPLGDAMDIIALINNAINFALYCTMSKQFRDTFLHLFCPSQLCASPKRSHLSNGTTQHNDNVSLTTCNLTQSMDNQTGNVSL